MPVTPRFPATARTAADATAYYRNRAVQALWLGWRWDGRPIEHGWGVEAVFHDPTGVPHHSIFVLEGHTGRGHLSRWFAAHPDRRFVTSTLCPKMKRWLDARGVKHVTIAPDPWPAYDAVTAFYGDRRARRSGQHLMNHIDEGLFVLRQIDAGPAVRDAWCLHPLVQADADLRHTWAEGRLDGLEPAAVALAMEYRHVANGYLSHHARPADWPRSPLPEVQQMLVADKVQNRKDFERYLRGDVPNGDRLDVYFGEWLDALGVDEARYHDLAGQIVTLSGGRLETVPGERGRRHLARAVGQPSSEIGP